MPRIERPWLHAFDPRYDVENPPSDVKTGFTTKQKRWIKNAYNTVMGEYFCVFPLYSEENGWTQCKNTQELQIHHITPQGYSKRILSEDPDRPDNACPLCVMHHNGTGYTGSLDHHNDLVPILHPDMEWARRNYHKYNKESYQLVFKGRKERTNKGEIYWNPDWDNALREIAERVFFEYVILHPEDQFPGKGVNGNGKRSLEPGEGVYPKSRNGLPKQNKGRNPKI